MEPFIFLVDVDNFVPLIVPLRRYPPRQVLDDNDSGTSTYWNTDNH